MPDDLYRLAGDAGTEYGRARQSVAKTITEAFRVYVQDPDTFTDAVVHPEKLAEAILARLTYLDPSMLVVSLERVDCGRWLCEGGHRIIKAERPETCPWPLRTGPSDDSIEPCGLPIECQLVPVTDEED